MLRSWNQSLIGLLSSHLLEKINYFNLRVQKNNYSESNIMISEKKQYHSNNKHFAQSLILVGSYLNLLTLFQGLRVLLQLQSRLPIKDLSLLSMNSKMLLIGYRLHLYNQKYLPLLLPNNVFHCT